MQTLDKSSIEFKKCMRNLPTGVAVVSTKIEGNYYGITVNSFTSVSLKPPMVLFCIEKDAARYEVFTKSKYFTINILSEDQSVVSKLFSEYSIDSWQDKFLPYDNNSELGSQYNIDKCILKGALATFYSEVKHIYSAGDHDIIIGEVLEMKNLSNSPPLVYHNGSYCTLQTYEK